MYQLKQLVPQPVKQLFHRVIIHLATAWYGHPSDKMIVIGVTGTKGKSTTSNLIGHLLDSPTTPTGFTTTANFKIAQKEWINDTKMTMLGRFQLQRLLSQMVQAGCKYAVVETSSQGIEQYRHIGVNYDYLVFTNLSPEHIEAHNGFENYKKAKGKLFAR
ncbi:MAG: Mur ligase family protein, partial [Janthinobacterium sp.]